MIAFKIFTHELEIQLIPIIYFCTTNLNLFRNSIETNDMTPSVCVRLWLHLTSVQAAEARTAWKLEQTGTLHYYVGRFSVTGGIPPPRPSMLEDL